jgi:hypothetical protein
MFQIHKAFFSGSNLSNILLYQIFQDRNLEQNVLVNDSPGIVYSSLRVENLFPELLETSKSKKLLFELISKRFSILLSF